MTFDTSLVDVKPPTIDANTSFSTVESDQASTSTVQPRPRVPIHHVPTQDAYNQWASQYDSDGNMLQAIDDIELTTFLPSFLSQIPNPNPAPSSIAEKEQVKPRILDLGCGTGRNTLKLLQHLTQSPCSNPSKIIGIDFSSAMLDIARSKLSPFAVETWVLHCCDMFSSSPFSLTIDPVHAILSTLVLEHIPLPTFFSTLSSLLLPSGVALITNMHHEMGRLGGQAGFVDVETGVKVRGASFVHEVGEVLEQARESGFEVVGVREREVTRGDLDGGVVGGRGEKWVGVKVWMGVLVRKVK
ncbi:hypothetical protein GGP41_003741 [Bipolaris sorokiniana]|uniref:Methyltransferase domain-containing protein n=1 Tax=Cochliobolus sativus TaxID=45130 RepID=A0A8H5ZCT9_COCSA|nr:hypothetical protein GGP41_003741 [Bipolaris sorokiniana]